MTSLFIIAGLNLIPKITGFKSIKIEKKISIILLSSLLLNITSIALIFNDIKIKGFYTNSIIGIIFIITCLLFFAIVNNNWKKILIVVILIPVIALTLITLFFSQSIAKFQINRDYSIEVRNGGLLSCGETIHIYKTNNLFFDEIVQNKNDLCVYGIYDIKTTHFDNKEAQFLIFHNEKLDSENPIKLELKRK
ncbi:hypothetical protein ACFSQ0_07265 [Mesonia sediminis]|uniref:DUF4131 domain-containing protein n=1 Tax=Mesonia sediminis TaxID=1703946 RepID=A0ABW5SDF7_9FLAO